MNFQKIAPLFAATAFTILSLGSCSGVSSPNVAHSFIVTIQATHNDNAQQLASWYKGKVLSFVPEAGFAILKVDQLPSSTDPKVQHIEKNSSLETSEKNLRLEQPNPVLTAGAKTGIASVGMSGWSTWSNGWSTWSNGWSTWSNGMTLPNPPAQNNPMFQNTRLAAAHSIARAYGAGVTVAVLDTGLDLGHPGVSGQLVSANRRWDFVGNDSDPSEVQGSGFGHGTAVTGLILQVAPDVTIMPLRVLDQNGVGDLDNVISAIDFAVRNNAQIINISLGAESFSEALRTMIMYAKSKQVYIIAAAGNQSRTDQAIFPAKMGFWSEGQDYLFSVGSLSHNDQISWFSNRGNDVSLFAPGENLVTFAPNSRIVSVTGTSFATPLVTGALALAYSNATDFQVKSNLGIYLKQSIEQQSIWWSVYRNTTTTWVHSLGKLDAEHLLYGLPAFSGNLPRIGRQDFVLNGNFETNSSFGWSTLGARIENLRNSGGVYSGDAGLVINNTGSATQRLTDLQPSTTYQVTAWARVFSVGENAVIGVRNHGTAVFSRAVTDADGFRQVSMTFTTGASHRTADLYFEKTSGWGPAAADLFVVTRN